MRRRRGHKAGQRDRKRRTETHIIRANTISEENSFKMSFFFCSELSGHQSCPSALTFSLSDLLSVCAQLTVFTHSDYLCLPAFSIPLTMKWSQKPPHKNALKLPCLLPNAVYNCLLLVWSFKTVFINNSENRCLFVWVYVFITPCTLCCPVSASLSAGVTLGECGGSPPGYLELY